MYIPPAISPLDGAYYGILRRFAEDSSSDSPVQKWSSTIGIVTALVGNVLISFALNTQRYAHMRIAKERDARRECERLVNKLQDTREENDELRRKNNEFQAKYSSLKAKLFCSERQVSPNIISR